MNAVARGLCCCAVAVMLLGSDLYAFTDSLAERIEIRFQMTTVTQFHPAFTAAYTGKNSMVDTSEAATSMTTTFAFLWHATPDLLVRFDPEMAGGAGLSKALGAAGFPNGETFRVGDPTPQFYVARLFAQYTIHLDDARELILTAGKYSLADLIDNNGFSHDPRTQFLNWSLMSNGAWDYAANTRGYTIAVAAEYGTDVVRARATAALIPTTANGPDLEWDLSRGHSETAELQYRYDDDATPGTIRVLGYITHAPMGNYDEAVRTANGGTPDVTATRRGGRTKIGFGINIEQGLTDWLGLFARVGWNDGQNETWAFTEIDRTVTAGLLANGVHWGRDDDRMGLAVAMNGVSDAHRAYLAAGGVGFMVGDGRLTYAPETLTELFYSIHLHDHHFWVTPTYEFLLHPAYNKDRGPIHVFSFRVHVEF